MISPQKALKLLKEGNERFWQGKSIHPNRSAELRNELLEEQKPYAVVVACSDSRVPVEIILDVGLGDIFVIRTAGHVLSKEVLGSIEYAVNALGVKLIVILGHDNCGAVKAAFTVYKSNKFKKLSENLKALIGHIYPVFDKLDKNSPNMLEEAICENIHHQTEDLSRRDEYINKKLKNDKIKIIGAKYSLKTGKIDFYD